MAKSEYWGGGGGKDVVEVTLRQLLQWINHVTVNNFRSDRHGPHKSEDYWKFAVKEKHQKGIALLTKTKQAIVTSAEVETDDLWCTKVRKVYV